MTTTIQTCGRLGHVPEKYVTASGKSMTTGALIVDLGQDAAVPEWFSLIGFGAVGEALAEHNKGDTIAVSGKLSKSTWTGKDGTKRTGFSVCIDSLASARTARPVRPKARPRAEQVAAQFDDALNF